MKFISTTLFLIIAPLVLSCLLPLRWIIRFWIFITLAIFGITAFETQSSLSNRGGIGNVIGIFILTTYAILVFSIITARLVNTIIKVRQNKIVLPIPSKAIIIADTSLFSIAGIILSIFIFKSLAFSLASLPHGFLIHGAISIFFLGLICVTWRLGYVKKYLRPKGNAFALSLLCSLFLFSSSGVLYPNIVIKNALSIAAEKPFCIALNKQARVVNSLEDLTFLTMDKDHGDHHALLLIEDEGNVFVPYHWSYIQSQFIQGVVNWDNENAPAIPCRPKPNFSQNIPFIEHHISENEEFYVHGYFLNIPKKYSPHIRSNYVSISAIAPDFKAAERRKAKSSASMEARSREWMERLQKEYSNLTVTEKIGNLNEIPNASEHSNRYYRTDEDGNLATVISCYDKGRPIDTACQHRFYKNDAMYSFDHGIDLLPQSDEMEIRLFELFESFKEK